MEKSQPDIPVALQLCDVLKRSMSEVSRATTRQACNCLKKLKHPILPPKWKETGVKMTETAGFLQHPGSFSTAISHTLKMTTELTVRSTKLTRKRKKILVLPGEAQGSSQSSRTTVKVRFQDNYQLCSWLEQDIGTVLCPRCRGKTFVSASSITTSL